MRPQEKSGGSVTHKMLMEIEASVQIVFCWGRESGLDWRKI